MTRLHRWNYHHAYPCRDSIMILASPFLRRKRAGISSARKIQCRRVASRIKDLTMSYLRCCGSIREVKSTDKTTMMTTSGGRFQHTLPQYDSCTTKPASAAGKSSVKQRNLRGSCRKSAFVSGIPYDCDPLTSEQHKWMAR